MTVALSKKGRIGVYRPSIKQMVKWHFKHFKLYSYTSVIGAVLLFSLLYLLTSVFKIHYILSFTIAYILVTTNAYFLNRLLVFRVFNPKRIHKQYYEFFISSVGAYVLNVFFLYIFVNFLNIWYLLAQAIICIVGLPLLYMAHRHIVFSHI
tara:strand:- start:130 stop:582 length:453 start_codon:yes stop_codon:yes gene_type:complete